MNKREFLKVAGATAGIGAFAWLVVDERGDRRIGDSHSVNGIHSVDPKEGVAGIQRVIDDHAPGITIRLGTGVYSGSDLRLENRVHLEGIGRNATTIRLANDANTNLISSSDPGNDGDMMVGFQNITFDGNKANNSSGDVVYGSFWNGRFVDCDFIQAPQTNFWLAGSRGGSTDDNFFRGCRFLRADGDGVRVGLNRQSGPAVGVARFDTCWFGTNAGNAIRLRGNDHVVSNGKFYANRGTDVFVDRGNRNVVVNNDLSKRVSNAPCVAVLSSKGIDSSRNQIQENRMFGSFRDAVYVEAAGNDVVALQVHDNNIRGRTKSENRTGNGIRAVGREYIDCSARDNTITGAFTGAPLNLPPSWVTSGNIT